MKPRMNKIVSGYTFGTQYSNTTRTSLCLKLMATWLFVLQLVQVPGYKLILIEHHFLRSPVRGESNIKPLPCHGVILWWKCIFIGPSMVGAEETSDYHIYGITQNWPDPWWRHQMETFSALLALCMGNSPVTGEFPSQWLVTRNFDVFFDLCLNKRLSKQSRRRGFETSSWSLWRHCNGMRVSWTYRYCHLEFHCWIKYI